MKKYSEIKENPKKSARRNWTEIFIHEIFKKSNFWCSDLKTKIKFPLPLKKQKNTTREKIKKKVAEEKIGKTKLKRRNFGREKKFLPWKKVTKGKNLAFAGIFHLKKKTAACPTSPKFQT